MKTVYTIETATNGNVLRVRHQGEEEEVSVVQDTGEDEKDFWIYFLRLLTDNHGPQYNKWGKEEVRISKRPGNKCDSDDDIIWFIGDVYGKSASKEQAEKIRLAIEDILGIV